MRKKLPTIREVAEAAGVSISTVSNVLYGKRGFYAPETAQRVWTAVEQLGYRPNHIARSLARRHTFTIGVVAEQLLGNVSHNLYFGVVLDGILQGATDRDYQVKIVRVPASAYEKAFGHIEDGSVEGAILLALPASNPIIERMEQSNIPSVVAGSIPPSSKLPCVDVEDIGATYQAVRWLISLGHRRIGIITGNLNYWSARRREQGYLMALREAGIEPHPAWRYEGNFSLAAGEAGALQLLRAEPPPTAIVCGNDRMAMGVLHALQRQGVKVPEQISVLGFDDEETATLTSPPLTTLRQPMFEIGLKAAELLLQQIELGKRLQHTLLLPAELVVRETVAPPPPDQ
ncbi:MAG: LacI family DNA-binding transcriptional regulator [Armatimonadota bacterium]|nr:LacI family transcriptional regulator [bacterium]MDW8321323.1 LacI family DNA-binding transcriptional regulator [Armatimonadota bacterium]